MDETELKDLLLKDSEEFRKLYEEHQSCESKLEGLAAKSFLSEEERLRLRSLGYLQ